MRSELAGNLNEGSKIEQWITELKKLDSDWEVVVDETDEYEISLTLVCADHYTQAERQEMAQQAKKESKALIGVDILPYLSLALRA